MSFASGKVSEPIPDDVLISQFQKLVDKSELEAKLVPGFNPSFEEVRDLYRFMVIGFCSLLLLSSLIVMLSSVVLIFKPKPAVFASSSDGYVFAIRDYDSAKSAVIGYKNAKPNYLQ